MFVRDLAAPAQTPASRSSTFDSCRLGRPGRAGGFAASTQTIKLGAASTDLGPQTVALIVLLKNEISSGVLQAARLRDLDPRRVLVELLRA